MKGVNPKTELVREVARIELHLWMVPVDTVPSHLLRRPIYLDIKLLKYESLTREVGGGLCHECCRIGRLFFCVRFVSLKYATLPRRDGSPKKRPSYSNLCRAPDHILLSTKLGGRLMRDDFS